MPVFDLPARPNLDHLKQQASRLERDALSGDAAARERFAAQGVTGEPKHADALHVIAKEYGFRTWPELKLAVAVRGEDVGVALAAAIRANDAEAVRETLRRHAGDAGLKAKLDEALPGFDFGQQALIAAVERDNRGMAEALLDAGADVNVRTRWWAGGFGVLETAKPEMAAWLIERGATVDVCAAARLGMVERVRELLAEDPARVRERGGDGQTALHYAATVEIAEMLLDAGAEVDARDVDHESTAAQYCVAMKPRREDVARLLVRRGAQTDILMASALGDRGEVERILNEDPETVRTTVTERYFPKRDARAGGTIYFYGLGVSRSPHMIAWERGHRGVFDLLMQRSAPWMRLLNAAEAGEEMLFRETLARHPEALAKMSERASRRLIGVALRNSTKAAEWLVEAGWPVGRAMDNGQTALHYAAWNGNTAMVKLLLEHGAAVNAQETEHGGSALAWALHGSEHSWHRASGDYRGVVKALLEAGAERPAEEQQPVDGAAELLAMVDGFKG